MRVLFASAEVDPFAKVGGLGDVAAALPQRLREMGHDVRVVAPFHNVTRQRVLASAVRRQRTVAFLGTLHTVDIVTVEGRGGVPVDLLYDGHFFGREAVYGEPDDLLRYQFFCRSILAMLTEDGWTPDILHINDWHTASLAFALRDLAWANPGLRGIASVFTIHNLRYRGPDAFNDFLAQAIYYSDMITTVSAAYAREILTPEFGEGLEQLLGLRQDALVGIINGLDDDLFNPKTDGHIKAQYDASSIDRRAQNTAALRAELGFPASDGPLAGMVTRLTEQKGIDIVIQAVPELVAAGAQLVVLGDGDASLERDFLRLQAEFPDHVRLAARFDERLAQRIYAGVDVFLMPSRYEPCGLGQLIAMRYGAVPIGRRTGGLSDTIVDLQEHPGSATGFLFDDFSVIALMSTFERALAAFREHDVWARLQRNGMNHDYSWRASALRYVEVYVSALRSRGVLPHN